MPRQVLVVHSSGPQGPRRGSGSLVASLRKALGRRYEVRYPLMPDPDEPTYERWRRKLRKELAALDDGAILLGHSLGGSVLLKCLSEQAPRLSIAAMHLLAVPFWGGRAGWRGREFALRRGFAARLPTIPRLFLYHSRDDEVVPFAHLTLYARALPNATVRKLDGYGHLFEKRCRDLIHDVEGAPAASRILDTDRA